MCDQKDSLQGNDNDDDDDDDDDDDEEEEEEEEEEKEEDDDICDGSKCGSLDKMWIIFLKSGRKKCPENVNF